MIKISWLIELEQVDRNRITEHYKDVYEFSEVVGEWEFAIEECPITLKIKVKRIAPNTYIGVADHGIKGPKQISPYRSMKPQNSVQKALEDALSGFFSVWDPKLKDQTEFVLDKEW